MKQVTASCVALALLGGSIALAHGEGRSAKFYPNIVAPQARAASAPPPGCTNRTLPQWKAWRQRSIAQLLKPRPTLEGHDGRFIDPDQVMAQSVAIANELDDCIAAFPSQKDAEKHIGNLRRFTSAQRNNLDVEHQFGHGPGAGDDTVTDFAYLKRVQSATELPCLLKSPAFLAKISDKASYREAWEMVQRQNDHQTVADCPSDGTKWDTLFYKSAILGTPDDANTFGRFLIVISGHADDKWIQFGIWSPDDKETADPIHNVSIVSVAKDPKTARRHVAIVDWWRLYDGVKDIRLATRREATGETGNCQQCHKTSVIGIHPESVYEFVGTGPTLVRAADQEAGPKTLNQRLRAGYNGPTQATGADDWFADPESFGPGLGPNSKGRWPRRSPAFMKACTSAQRLDEQAIARVQSRMDCAECHQPGGRGQLNFPMATQLTKATQLKDGAWPNLVYAYVSKGLMPPNQPALDPAEREALFECLMQEYYDPRRKSGVLVDWLNNRPAPDSPKARTSVELLARTTLSAQPRYQANAAGAKEFERECAACHATVAGENSDGPSLFAVVGRRAGAASGFGYSPALAEAGEKGLAWTEQNLDGFLIDQEAYLSARLGRSAAPAMSNVYHDDGFRKLIIEYLMTLR